MSKCQLSIDGKKYIIDQDKAIEVFKIITSAQMESLEYDYIPKTDATKQSEYRYYIKKDPEGITLSGVNEEDYAMWVLYTAARGQDE